MVGKNLEEKLKLVLERDHAAIDSAIDKVAQTAKTFRLVTEAIFYAQGSAQDHRTTAALHTIHLNCHATFSGCIVDLFLDTEERLLNSGRTHAAIKRI